MKASTQSCVLVVAVLLAAGGVALFWPIRQASTQGVATTNTVPLGANSNAVEASTQAVAVREEEPFPGAPAREVAKTEIVGIGAIVMTDGNTGALMIKNTVPNSPAAAAGLAGNFIIRKIDDIMTEGMSIAECVKQLRGVAGTTVRLELFDVDANETRIVELTRQKIQIQTLQPPTR